MMLSNGDCQVTFLANELLTRNVQHPCLTVALLYSTIRGTACKPVLQLQQGRRGSRSRSVTQSGMLLLTLLGVHILITI